MKTNLLIILSFLVINIYGQIDFQTHVVMDNSYGIVDPKAVASGDLNGDGNMDVIATPVVGEKILWYESLDGAGTFDTAKVIADTAVGYAYAKLYTVDLDGDGDLDVLTNRLWIENLDGQGNFGEEKFLEVPSGFWVRIVYPFDIDNDGDLDIILGTDNSDNNPNKLYLFENIDGDGTFTSPEEIGSTIHVYTAATASDINGDGKLDLLTAVRESLYTRLGIFESLDGQGSFTNEQVFITGIPDVRSIISYDLDSDGDNDALYKDPSDDKIIWMENLDGLGEFGDQEIIWTDSLNISNIVLEDMDNDNDMDIVLGGDDVGWLENMDGAGNFGTKEIISSTSGIVVTTDMNGDQSTDIITFSSGYDRILWQENINNGEQFGTPKVIDEIQIDHVRAVHAADIDGDGDLDMLSASSGDDVVAWYENTDGLGTFGEQNRISSDYFLAADVFAADLDGDMDVDVIALGNGDISWFENLDGQGNFGPPILLLDNMYFLDNILAIDLDKDNDMDILYGGVDKIGWFENIDGQGNFSDELIIDSIGVRALSVNAADLDGDDDLDVYYAGLNSSGIFGGDGIVAWYENLDGQGFFGSENIISTDVYQAVSVHAADFNGDGHIDICSASLADDKIAWYPNLDGTGNFSVQIVIPSGADWPRSIAASDIDSDGDMDIVCTSGGDDRIIWHENIDGQGGFQEEEHTISTSGSFRLYVSDINDDGNPDILSATGNDDRVEWHENLNPPVSLEEMELLNVSIFPNPVDNHLYIQTDWELAQVIILDKLGRTVMSVSNQSNIDISKLASGTYLLKITNADGDFGIKKIVKK